MNGIFLNGAVSEAKSVAARSRSNQSRTWRSLAVVLGRLGTPGGVACGSPPG